MSRPPTEHNAREVSLAIDVDIPTGGGAAYPVSLGCPLPEGWVPDVELLRIENAEARAPLQPVPSYVGPTVPCVGRCCRSSRDNRVGIGSCLPDRDRPAGPECR